MKSNGYLDLNIHLKEDGFEVIICDPETGNCKNLGWCGYDDGNTEYYGKAISREIMSWVSVWKKMMEEEEEYLSQEKFNTVKEKLHQMMLTDWRTPEVVACIYDLYQDYIISETQESELYRLADPYEEYNECSKYYEAMDYENPLRKVIGY